MDLMQAVAKRIDEVCESKQKTISEISLNGGMNPNTVYGLLKGRTKHSTVITIKRFCMGAGITLREFFAPEYFNDYED